MTTKGSKVAINKSSVPLAVLELTDKSTWAVEEWDCQFGIDCAGAHNGRGAFIGYSCEGDAYTPFVVVMADGTTWLICEDCASEQSAVIEENKARDYEYVQF